MCNFVSDGSVPSTKLAHTLLVCVCFFALLFLFFAFFSAFFLFCSGSVLAPPLGCSVRAPRGGVSPPDERGRRQPQGGLPRHAAAPGLPAGTRGGGFAVAGARGRRFRARRGREGGSTYVDVALSRVFFMVVCARVSCVVRCVCALLTRRCASLQDKKRVVQ